RGNPAPAHSHLERSPARFGVLQHPGFGMAARETRPGTNVVPGRACPTPTKRIVGPRHASPGGLTRDVLLPDPSEMPHRQELAPSCQHSPRLQCGPYEIQHSDGFRPGGMDEGNPEEHEHDRG